MVCLNLLTSCHPDEITPVRGPLLIVNAMLIFLEINAPLHNHFSFVAEMSAEGLLLRFQKASVLLNFPMPAQSCDRVGQHKVACALGFLHCKCGKPVAVNY